MLFQLEGAMPKAAASKAKVAAPISAAALSPLKKANATTSKRSNWFYAVVLGSILVGISTLFFLLMMSGSPIATQIANIIQGRQAVTEINGVPLNKVPNAVMQINPQDRSLLFCLVRRSMTLWNMVILMPTFLIR